jgi:membrane protease YdiL (CAAX protease family)
LHGFWFDNNLAVHIDIIALRNSFISGFIFAWLKDRSNSLLMPIVAHGIEDFLFFIPRMV